MSVRKLSASRLRHYKGPRRMKPRLNAEKRERNALLAQEETIVSAMLHDDAVRAQIDAGNALFATDAECFETSADLAIIFDEATYAFNQPYGGGTTFNKHYTPLIGDLEDEGEEFDCAVYLDRHPMVRYWIRNVDRKPSSFWLQLPKNKFYPDFVAMLTDGRIFAVEYKGKHLYESETDKRRIGEAWAAASDGQCLFCMPTERDYGLIDRTIATASTGA